MILQKIECEHYPCPLRYGAFTLLDAVRPQLSTDNINIIEIQLENIHLQETSKL